MKSLRLLCSLCSLLFIVGSASAAAFTNAVPISSKTEATSVSPTNLLVCITGTTQGVHLVQIQVALGGATNWQLAATGAVAWISNVNTFSGPSNIFTGPIYAAGAGLFSGANTFSGVNTFSGLSNLFNGGPIYGTNRLADGTAALSITNTFYATDVSTNRTTNTLVFLHGLLKSWTVTP